MHRPSDGMKVRLTKDGKFLDRMMPLHSACWNAVGGVPGCNACPEWWDSFVALLDSFSSHLNCIPYLDKDIWPEKRLGAHDQYSSFAMVEHRPIWPCVLPIDIIHMIYDHLDCYEDVMNLQEATLIEPLSALWLRLGRRFLTLANFRDGEQSDVSLKIQRSLWKIHHVPDRFPQAVNFSVVWDNGQQVLKRMKAPLFGKDTTSPLDGLYTPHSFRPPSDSPQRHRKKSPQFNEMSEFCLRFTHVGGKLVLCGISIGKSTTGYLGEYVEHVGHGICGLRLISNQNAFESVQLKRHESWETEWHGCTPTQSNSAVLSELEWDPKVVGSLLLELDVSVVHFSSIA